MGAHQPGVDCTFRCMRCGCMRDDLDDGAVEQARVDAELAKVVAWLRSLETWEEAAGLADALECHAHRKETR